MESNQTSFTGTLKNFFAVFVGLVAGGIANMAIVKLSHIMIPPPAGADLNTAEGWKAAQSQLTALHYLSPFFAHAAGALVGAFITSIIAVSNKLALALTIGFFFLAGGIMACFMIPAPTWFIILDLAMAYLPMAWIGFKISSLLKKQE